MHVQNLMNSLRDIRILLGLVPKESPCSSRAVVAAVVLVVAIVEVKEYVLFHCTEQRGNSLINIVAAK